MLKVKISRKKIRIGIVAALLAVLILDLAVNAFGVRPKADGVAQGLEKLQELDGQDLAQADSALAALAKKHQEESGELLREQVESGEVDPFTLFSNYVICGDSRTVAFKSYQLLEERRIIADVGWNLKTLSEHVEDIAALNPINVFVSIGLNDVNNGDAQDMNLFTQRYADCLSKIQTALPDATIYVNSILPVGETALAAQPFLAQIPDANAHIKQICEENGYVYIDNDDLVAEHSDLLAGDGIHFAKSFYQYWAENMLVAQIRHDSGVDAS